MIIETWKSVPFYESLYEASSLGNIRRVGRTKILKGDIGNSGYKRIVLFRSRTNKVRFLWHRVIAATFIGPCPIGWQVNHKNGIKLDNRIENIEYVTISENQKHAYTKLGKQTQQGIKHGCHKLTNEQVIEIRKIRGTGKEFDPMTKRGPRKSFRYPKDHPASIYSLAKKYNVCPGTIAMICNRKIWTHIIDEDPPG